MTLFFRNRRAVAGLPILRGLLVSVMTSVLVAGCATVGPDYVAPELNPPIQWSGETGSRINSDPLDPAALNRWWTTLQDPLLTRLIDRAATGNLNLRDAEARIRQARARRGVSVADRFPTLNASGAATRSRISETGFYEGTTL